MVRMADRLRFAHVSDLHAGAMTETSAQRLIDDVRRQGADATIVSGDLTMRAKAGEFEIALALLNELPQPQLLVPGNHDVPLYNPARRMLLPYSKYLTSTGAELDSVLELDGAKILGLNSMPRWRWKGGRISARQIQLIDDVLGAGPAGGLRVVAMHHPPLAHGSATVRGRGALLRALVSNRVDLVLAGHNHIPAIKPIAIPDEAGNGAEVLEVVAGTATSTRVRGGIERSWMHITTDNAEITVVERRDTADGWQTSNTVTKPRNAR